MTPRCYVMTMMTGTFSQCLSSKLMKQLSPELNIPTQIRARHDKLVQIGEYLVIKYKSS